MADIEIRPLSDSCPGCGKDMSLTDEVYLRPILKDPTDPVLLAELWCKDCVNHDRHKPPEPL